MKRLFWVLAVVWMSSGYNAEACRKPLGIKFGRRALVPDANMTASSHRDSMRAPHHGRLHGPKAWCSKTGSIAGSWIMVSFGERKRVTGIITQGSKKDFIWVTRYRVEYRVKGGPWIKYPKELVGNSIINYPAGNTNMFEPALIAHDFRVHPLDVAGVISGSEKVDFACLRLELLGCKDNDPCSKPNDLTNGWHSNNSYRHGDHVTYSCNQGYRLVGTRNITCYNGEWKGRYPLCIAKCPNLGTIPNGNYTTGVTTGGEVAKFTCTSGHDLIGAMQITCVMGKWGGVRPRCLARCPHPGVPSHGLIERLRVRHGETTLFRCDLGYSLIGSDMITCSDGKWIPDPPQCKGGCSDPGTPENGQRIGNDFSNGGSLAFTCDRNFSLDGPSLIKCKAGLWSSQPPQCRASCSDPGIPDQGMRSGDDLRHGGHVYYFCQDGFTMKGRDSAQCVDGNWTTPKPECLDQTTCPDPGFPQHGSRIGYSSFKNMGVVQFMCTREGYDLQGPGAIRCINGTWNAATPTCKARCAPIKPSSNVIVLRPISNRHGSEAVFGCKAGFRLVGSSVLACNDGTWNDSVPVCIRDDDDDDCSDPGTLTNGGRHGNNFSDGQRVSFFCNNGYTLFGVGSVSCDDGEWSGDVPTCRADCQDPGVPVNGGRHGNNFSEGQRVGFFCSSGHVIDGPSEIMCVNGRWSDKKPTCRAGCAQPSTPPNSVLYIGSRKSYYSDQERVFYLCKPGFFLVGMRERQCMGNNWTSVAFKCISTGCGDPGTPLNGQKIGLTYRVRDRVYYTCLPGFRMIGPSKRVCMSNGTWAGYLPHCVASQCPDLPIPQYGVKQVTTTAYKGETSFTCTSRGYELVGSKVRVCLFDGTWSGKQPSCERVICRDPGTPKHGSRAPTFGILSFRDSVDFSCSQGYTLTGRSRIFCLEDGTWSDKMPVCVGTPKCPVNWQEYNGRCYWFKHETKRNQIWKRLQRRCRKLNARLLSINDSGEWDFIRKHLKSSVSRYAIGLQKTKGSWRWTGGGKLRYAQWSQRDDAGGECVTVRGRDGLFEVVSCRKGLGAYICEKAKRAT
ncbi:CUB and sushi domain-containing protein 3 isoform X3 [Nematostella vectensis]|uniref:CUB and sushi domain-containing protein 3 isoform X3 n=1 Tax=Nematostella vectensis TaxID=45351 RepID=UPI0020774642|nr:CUB and sushi domain-containing protein 3 isoform X3 [Nematostella vectensis]